MRLKAARSPADSYPPLPNPLQSDRSATAGGAAFSQARIENRKEFEGALESQARQNAEAVYQAMHGGQFGWGCDTEAVLEAFRGQPLAQVERIRFFFEDRYGRKLDTDLRSELSAEDEADRAADALYQAMHGGMFGWGCDVEAVRAALEHRTPDQITLIHHR